MMAQTNNTTQRTSGEKKAQRSRDASVASTVQPPLARFDQPGRWPTILIGLLLFFVALGFNLYQIGAPSIWFDEALSVTRAQQTLPVLFKLVSVTQPNMALYYFV